jgi:hypothetical protein
VWFLFLVILWCDVGDDSKHSLELTHSRKTTKIGFFLKKFQAVDDWDGAM